MHVTFNLLEELEQTLKAAAATAGLADAAAFAPEVRTADPRHGDFQANGVLAYAKARKMNPRQVAEKLMAALPATLRETYDLTIAGPGFINFTLKPAVLLAWLQAHDSAEHLRKGAAAAHAGQTWVVDYSSPNTAKQMHVGHLRSAVIGEAICRLLAFTGANVVRDNHLGDWGTQFGKLIYGYKRWVNPEALAQDPIEELERLYKAGNNATPEGSPELEEARQELVKLQNGDPESYALWQKFSEVSLGAFQQIYDRLGIRFDHNLGESFYNDKVDRVYRELTETGLAENSEGALVVFHDEHPRFSRNAERPNPFMVRKADGASGYASTDLATALYRAEHFKADGIVIVTDFRQSDHFEQLFLTLKKWFAAKHYRLPELHHVTFGAVTGEDGKALKTRSGDVIKLKALLDEAEERAFAIVSEKNPELSETERREIARVVGVGAVQYADLSQNRSSNYVFSWDKMLSLEGNTAPYLLYAIARIHSIFRKAGATPAAPETEAAATVFETPTELTLARKIAKFPDAVRLAGETLRPHYLSLYLFELAGDYSSFNNADKVLVDDPAVRARRLLLCARTLLILESGLGLLGLRTLTRM
ncbi:arginine--tRNA ligase [Opitutus sp. ER46]|uniref:arginine--tRNA ligase n=1 Tax=Opitutus sp. ER46 TaxID=2161864 RepID=UPI000D2F8757|nr:arginine--tRNA ligase [Opitutus sp. ER46]PTY00315.1 arginine--tRNA ligase [Opitutus sp. ER46]